MDFNLKYRQQLIEIGFNILEYESELATPPKVTITKMNIADEYFALLEKYVGLVNINTHNAGFCDQCGSTGAVVGFNFKFLDTILSYTKHCINCANGQIRKAATTLMMEAADRITTYEVLNNYNLRFVATSFVKAFLEPKIEPVTLHECQGCYGFVAHPNEYPDTPITGVVVGDTVAHINCTWTCSECEVLEINIYERAIPRRRTRQELDGASIHANCLIKKLNKEFDDVTIRTINDIPDEMICSSCDFYFLKKELIYFDWMNNVECERCANNYRSCNDCGWDYTAYTMDGHNCEDNQNLYDDDDDDNGDRRIHNYGYKPRPKFQGNDSHVYTGLELEVEANQNRENLEEGVDLMESKWDNAFYLKYDGSISYGFEIVSHPHTLKAWHDVDWSFLTGLQKMGYRSWNTTTCGIHVHLGLQAFKDEAHEIRFAKIIYDNQRQVERIAGRSNSSYASFEGGKGTAVKKIKNKTMDSNHFAALNVSNGITFEVRVFKGSLRKERVLSAIEFVNANCEYTRNLKVAHNKKPFSWGAFVSYVGNNVDLYPNLFIIINETFETATETGEQD